MKCVLGVVLLLVGTTWAASEYRLCAPEEITETMCNKLSRGTSRVVCERVKDRTECAVKMQKGTADFGVFNAEELLLTYQFYPDEIKPIAQLKHKDRTTQNFEFQTVVVVPESFNHNEGLHGLKNGGLCHPGFSDSQIWNDYVLKFFERKAWDQECRTDASVGENEAINLKNFFGRACRPGEWVKDKAEDKKLKQKYPELCELCDNAASCGYYNTEHHGHLGALECLVSGRGQAAYAAYDHVYQFFGVNLTGPEPRVTKPGFQFLCPNGTPRPLTATDPCAWISQPWSVIASRQSISSELTAELKSWLENDGSSNDWIGVLSEILQADGKIFYFAEEPTLRSYLVTGRQVEVPDKTCGNTIRWCTTSTPETWKCKWVAKEALLLGIEPKLTCVETNSTFECLRAISENIADIITIDSNYGHLARTIFNLTTVLYAEPEKNKNSAVIAVVKDSSSAQFVSFKDIKKKTACFPEYGGIAWLSLINVARSQKIISDTCDYPKALADVFSGACTPGINDINHSDVALKTEIVEQLCSNCPIEKANSTCSANADNIFYGDQGVLRCLQGPGDIGFVEPKNVGGHIRAGMINPNDYRVLCKNGTLATYTGFDVDENCALSITIDSEVIGRWNNPVIDSLDTSMALLKLEAWLGYDAYTRRAIRIYDSFTGQRDLLFKESTVGLEPKDSSIQTVLAYKELFDSVESCHHSGVGSIFVNTLALFGPLLIIIVLF